MRVFHQFRGDIKIVSKLFFNYFSFCLRYSYSNYLFSWGYKFFHSSPKWDILNFSVGLSFFHFMVKIKYAETGFFIGWTNSSSSLSLVLYCSTWSIIFFVFSSTCSRYCSYCYSFNSSNSIGISYSYLGFNYCSCWMF
jgi:hypothetical protein